MVLAMKIYNPYLHQLSAAQMLKVHPNQCYQISLWLVVSIFLEILPELQAEQLYFWSARVAWFYPPHTD